MVGLAEFKNKESEMIPYEPYVMVQEVGDMFVKTEEGWIVYAQLRLSSLLEKTGNGWRILHQHGSYPDSKTNEGETFAFDSIQAENKKLRDSIKSRTLELERKNRELEIEAALERVRSRMMAMQKTDDLQDVINKVYHQLKRLNIPISGGAYVIVNKDVADGYSFWGASAHADYMQRASVVRLERPIFTNIIDQIKNDTGFFAEEHSYEEKMEYFYHLLKHPPLKHASEEQKQEILSRKGAYHRSSFVSQHTTITIINHHGQKFSNLENEILTRLAKVFEQAYIRFLDIKRAEDQSHKIMLINKENERLLHSILPEPIVEQIRSKQKNVVKRFDAVSILFADLVGFTVLSEKLPPAKLVDILNSLFSKFDDLTDQYELEKIKTIGDAYMVASGVPEEKTNHAITIFHFAQDILRSLEEYNKAHQQSLRLRIGISSGPVVAGVIGKKKFAYDLWGDTVNTAARMEAYGRESCIQISPSTYEILKNDFEFEKITDMEVKGKGKMDVYLWKGE